MKLGVIQATDGVFADQILGERERQEDAVAHRVFNDGDSMLVVLADGMGGHQGGRSPRKQAWILLSAHF